MKKLFLKLQGWCILLFGNAKKFDEFIKEHINDAVNIVETIKYLVENPVVTLLIEAFPAKFGDRAKIILERIQKYIDIVFAGLDIAAHCQGLPTLAEKLTCYVNALRNKPAAERANYYQGIAENYAAQMSKENNTPIPKALVRTLIEVQHAAISADQKGIRPVKDITEAKKAVNKVAKKAGK